MHAIISTANGDHYVSAVFGCYSDPAISDPWIKVYWVVWDEHKERLIKWQTYRPKSPGGPYMWKQVLIVESDKSDWKLDDEWQGCVSFLNRHLLDSIIAQDHQPEDILAKCRAMDEGYVYEPIQEVKTPADADSLDWVAGNFHDAYIKKKELQADGKLYLRFSDVWGCEIEAWFWGDLEYSMASRDPEVFDDPYWFSATILLQDGFVYLIDDENMTVEKLTDQYCYFKARHMQYRVIPET